MLPTNTKTTQSDDYKQLALLLLLYTLQGIPMGLSGSVPFLMQANGATLSEQAKFSVVSWPFSFKLLWAPLVDAIYSPRLGRRKTWILPAQAAIGLTLLAAAPHLETLIGANGTAAPDVNSLTWLFLVLYLLAATQDIAVDGLALTILSEKNKELGATCNAVGQSIGYFSAYTIFLALNTPEFCNRHFRAADAPSPHGLVSLRGFVTFWAWVFLFSTVCVFFVRRDEHTAPRSRPTQALAAAYGEMVQVLRLPSVRGLVGVMLTCKVGLAVFDAVTPLRLVEAGVPREHLALLASIVMPLGMASQTYVSYKYFSSAKSRPMSVWLTVLPFRLVTAISSFLLVKLVSVTAAPGGELPYYLYALMFCATVLATLTSQIMFVAQMAFYNKVSDPAIGGTYMTMLNTVSNLGSAWPTTAALFAVGLTTVKRCPCEGAPRTVFPEWMSDYLPSHVGEWVSSYVEDVKSQVAEISPRVASFIPGTRPADGECPCPLEVEIDGFTVVAIASAIVGIAWIVLMRSSVLGLETLPSSEWRVGKRRA